MESKMIQIRKYALFVLLMGATLALAAALISPTSSARSKSPAAPIPDGMTPEQMLAQDLALSDSQVLALTTGRPSEVFGVRDVGDHFPASASACHNADCRQVEIYNWDENATVVALVNLDSRMVVEVFHQPGVHPGINKRLADLAIDIIASDPEVAKTLGYQPSRNEIFPMEAGLLGSSCDSGHICYAATFPLGDRFMWATADLHTESLAGIGWSPAPVDHGDYETTESGGCPAPGNINQGGWTLDYAVTGTDGLRSYNVKYNGVDVATSIKLVEWHADYGSSGYTDYTGCGGGGGGFPIYTYGNTQVNDLNDGINGVVGFEVVQDFRMGNWGYSCNYRYEQHHQFFNDGRFRVVSGAFGKGCGTNALYRPVVRVDIAVAGDANDTMSYYDGANWVEMTTEDYRTPYTEAGHGPHQVDANGYYFKVEDTNGSGFYLELDQGQFPVEGAPPGEGSNPFLYATLHKAAEGDTDLGIIGSCCNDNHVQGPHTYVNGENIADNNLVLWYVPQMDTDASSPDYYCWTVSGEPNPETYPCFAGPMFHPIGDAPLPLKYRGLLKGNQEVPPVTTTGRARAQFLNQETQVRWKVRGRSFPNGTVVTGIHVHCAAAGANGPVGVTLMSGSTVQLVNFLFQGNFTAPDAGNSCGWTTRDDVLQAMIDGNAYVNVHTVANPSGEVRGQISPLP